MSKNVSNNFKNIIKSGGPFYAYATVKLVDGTTFTIDSETDFFATGNSYSEDAGDGFPLGSALSKQISIHLDNHDERFSGYDFYGAEIVLYTETDIPGGTTERILEGTFTVIDSVAPGNVLDITAYDDMYKLDSDFTSNLVYPATLQQIWNELCDYFDVSNGSPQFKNNDFIVQTKPDGATGREMAGYIAQIAVGNAVADANGRLCIKSYDFSQFNESDTVVPGEIETDSGIHILSEFMSDPIIGTDDVVITGITTSVTNDEGETSTVIYGDDEYAIFIDNPLITGKEQTAIALIGDELIGLSVRPFSGDFVPNPTIEVMDLVYIVDKKDKVYKSFVTSHGFTYLGFSNVTNNLESPQRNKSTYSNNTSKIYQHVAQQLNNQKTQWETAVGDLQDELKNASGLYPTEEKQPDGSTIYYFHDKPTLEESQVVFKITSQAIAISTDGGETYPTGITVNGEAIISILQTIGINADWINAGAIKVTDNEGNTIFLVDMDTKQILISGDSVQIGGKSATEAINEALEAAQNAGGINLQLDNDFQGISTDYEGNISGSFPECKTTAQVFYGQTDITNNCVFTTTKSESITGSWNNQTKTYTVTGLSADSGWVDITATYLTTISVTKRFGIEKVKGGVPGQDGQDGQPGRTFFIEPSATILKRTKDNAISPSQISFSAYYRDGDSATRYSYSGRWIIDTTSNGSSYTEIYRSSSNESSVSRSLTGISSSVIQIRARLYASGGFTTMIDSQSVTIVNDVDSLTPLEVLELISQGMEGIYSPDGVHYYINASAIKSGQIQGIEIISESGNDWMKMSQSLLTGGYRSTTDGLLDLSANYSSGRHVVLESKTGDVILKSSNEFRVQRQSGGMGYLVQSGGTDYFDKIEVSFGDTYPIIGIMYGTDEQGYNQFLDIRLANGKSVYFSGGTPPSIADSFLVRQVSVAVTQSHGYGERLISLSYSGYKALGVVGYSISSTYHAMYKMNFDSSKQTVTVGIRHVNDTSASASINVYLQVLYV